MLFIKNVSLFFLTLASPSEKADVKKQILPILIGCLLLFGAVNLVAIISDFSAVLKT